MRNVSERWYACRLRTRCIYLGVSTGVVLLGAYWMLARPPLVALSGLQAQQAQGETARRTLWQTARQQPVASVDAGATVVLPFSPLDFQTAGTQLIRWQPGPSGGELTLEADWAHIPALFSGLAQRGMGINTFSVAPGKTRLLLVAKVEYLDAK